MKNLTALTAGVILLGVIMLAASPLTNLGAPKGVSTFESIGFTLPFSGDGDLDSKCTMRYRKYGETTWKAGHDLFRCPEKREFRGSLVHLSPGTQYEVEFSGKDPDGGKFTKKIVHTTWNECFPEGKVTIVTNRDTVLKITESGTPNAYRVFQAPKGKVSVINAKTSRNCITIAASYVIVRGFKCMNSKGNAIDIAGGKSDIVIEDCEITQWGPHDVGVTGHAVRSGIYVRASKRVIIQRNDIHHPNGAANSWAQHTRTVCAHSKQCHPTGPQAIAMQQSLGNHVIRYNRMRSGPGHYYDDVLGGGSNGGPGNINCDSDIYGNEVSHCFDDGLEVEGHNINVRIWGNIIHHVYQGVATTATNRDNGVLWMTSDAHGSNYGPQYIWRNVFYELWMFDPQFAKSWGVAAKPGNGTKIGSRGGYYFYNNTFLKHGGTRSGLMGINSQCLAENVIGKNNILDASLPIDYMFIVGGYSKSCTPLLPPRGNFFDYNMFTMARKKIECGKLTSQCNQLKPEWELHGLFSATPQYVKQGDSYYLRTGNPGIDRAAVIPNFSDVYSGKAPDMGACEKGAFELAIGPESQKGKVPGCNVSIGKRPAYHEDNLAQSGFNLKSNAAHIGYSLSRAADIHLAVYNAKGQMVRKLFEGYHKQGHFARTLNLQDYGSGLFFLRLSHAGTIKTAKIMHIR